MHALICGPGRIYALRDDPTPTPAGWTWVEVPEGTTRLDTWDGVQVVSAPASDPAAGRRAEVAAALTALDAASVRAVRAVAAGTATSSDTARLADIEAQAAALRAELSAVVAVQNGV